MENQKGSGRIIKKARNLAIKIIQEDPSLDNYNLIKNQLKIDYKENLHMIKLN